MSAKWRGAAAALCGVIAACSTRPQLPPPPPALDMCAEYRSFRYSKAAADVEAIESLRSHNYNEARYAEKCLLVPTRPAGGPR